MEILFVAGLFKAFEECLPDQSAPNGRRFLRGNTSATACEIEVVPPAVFGILPCLVRHEPIETPDGFVAKGGMASGFESQQIPPDHEAPAFGGIEGFYTNQWTDIPRRFPDELLQEALSKKIAKGEWPQPRGETIARIVPLIVTDFDPLLQCVQIGFN